MPQPVNSPDTNLLDLGFFQAVQSANDEVASGATYPTNLCLLPRQKINQTRLSITWETILQDSTHEQNQDGMGRLATYSSQLD